MLTHDLPGTALWSLLLGVMEEISASDASPAVIGFDDPEWARVLGISVVAGDVEELGRCAARLALARLGDRTREPESVVVPMRLIVRRSTSVS